MKLILTIYLTLITLFSVPAMAENMSMSKSDEMTESGHAMHIKINSASAKQLQALKGVGAKKAKAIVDYRQANGDFQSVDELTQVKGIGKKVLVQNQGLLSL